MSKRKRVSGILMAVAMAFFGAVLLPTDASARNTNKDNTRATDIGGIIAIGKVDVAKRQGQRLTLDVHVQRRSGNRLRKAVLHIYAASKNRSKPVLVSSVSFTLDGKGRRIIKAPVQLSALPEGKLIAKRLDSKRAGNSAGLILFDFGPVGVKRRNAKGYEVGPVGKHAVRFRLQPK